jgi:serine/threonine protein kinase
MTRATIGRYEIQSEVGHGGMAAVYLAYDPSFRRSVAIKLVSVNLQEHLVFRERFEREAQLIARIEHPAIVPVYDYGEEDNQPYLVMRYMPGGTLAHKIKEGPLHLGYASQIISQIAPALDAVHSQGVIHRDLKPANILLDGFGNPAISDFGIAHFTLATTDLTGSAIIGTPSYMSPEQVRGDNDLDGRSDIYALGVILFEMLTGSGPFRAPTPLSVAMKHLTEPIPSILSYRPDVPTEVDLILTKAMAKDREMRYTSASELANALREISDTVKQEGKPAPRSPITARNEELSTEVDTAEKSEPALASTSSEQPEIIQAISQPSRQTIPPGRSLIRPIAGLTGTGLALCLVAVCSFIGIVGLWSRLGLPNLAVKPTLSTTSTTDSRAKVLFSDDFSNPSSGWPTIQNTRGEYSYQSDGYHIVVDEIESVLWAKTSTEFDNSSIFVDTKPLQRSKNGYFGLLCRIRDDQNFYYFVIRNNGEYTIGKYKNAEFQSLLTEGWKQNQAVKPGTQTNQIRADCSSETLRLYVNNVLLDEVTDTDFSSGFSGILAASLDSQGFEVLFNKFLITEPDQ